LALFAVGLLSGLVRHDQDWHRFYHSGTDYFSSDSGEHPVFDDLDFLLIIFHGFQEAFRFIIYTILRKTEKGLEEIADSVNVSENKHILAYVSGLGFGVISGAFALVNILADSVGPATMGLKAGTDIFFITSAAQTLCFILLNTFWNVIFFHALDKKMYASVVGVVTTHLAISCLTLANSKELYLLTLLPSYLLVIATGAVAFKACGGTKLTFLRFVKCQ
jgi:gamma-secretase subunit APH-1